MRTNQALAAARRRRCSRSWAASRCACTHTATPAGWRPSSGAPRSASSAPCTSGGQLASVTADETRPLLQGSRLTAFELVQLGIDHRIVVDGAGPSVIARGLADAVIVGADRIAANGDVANKIGTYPLALAAARAGIPFVVAAPESTHRPGDAVGRRHRDRGARRGRGARRRGRRVAPEGSRALNPAFDVTPADLVTAIVTERRVIRPALGERP